jgi:hypothetical protein
MLNLAIMPTDGECELQLETAWVERKLNIGCIAFDEQINQFWKRHTGHSTTDGTYITWKYWCSAKAVESV